MYVKKGYRLVAIPFQKRHENTNAIAHKKVYVCKHEPHMEWNGITMMSYNTCRLHSSEEKDSFIGPFGDF